MNNEIRWKQRFQNFEKAYNTFNRMIDRYEKEPQDEAIQMALVQSFEFTFELAWNTMKDYLENDGYNEVKNGKHAIRVAFQDELIDDAETWMVALLKRNLTSHTYNNHILLETVVFIHDDFFPIVRDLYFKFKSKMETLP
ncbi:MAG: nucleotidyltransferase substrate binding protein [Desulfamplus sp.]|nr:nucleotidyltransferase substrate binding protein [Desulfamplus sp.]